MDLKMGEAKRLYSAPQSEIGQLVTNNPIWSNDDIIKATPPENRKSLFSLGKSSTRLHRRLYDRLCTTEGSSVAWSRRRQAPAVAAQAELRLASCFPQCSATVTTKMADAMEEYEKEAGCVPILHPEVSSGSSTP
ncbi:hypothetical protein CHARACLAT_022399 [Characodon lateralis]|uniref:Uncharacterized protein n=1 Tax=Characodon lateralis TaxID=208331 RepID=A0ABU7DBC8_9TELE|nr:hypothetical protein [Characodon lateralis]